MRDKSWYSDSIRVIVMKSYQDGVKVHFKNFSYFKPKFKILSSKNDVKFDKTQENT